MGRKEFRLIGKKSGKFVLFISPVDYFGSNGYKTHADNLKEVFKLLEKYSNKFIRLQSNRPNRVPNYYRVLIKPGRIVDATNNIPLTERLFK